MLLAPQIPKGELIVREGEIHVHFDRLAALLNRFVGEVRNEEKLRQIGVDDERQRIEVLRFLHLGDRVGVPSE